MDDHARVTDSVSDQTEEEKLLIFTVSELEKAAGGTTWAQTNTCVRTICVGARRVG
jgi:hypothetical protein